MILLETTAVEPALPETRAAHVVDQEAVNAALSTDPVAVRIGEKNNAPCTGERVGVRLNLNVLRNTGVAVQTLHAATNGRGYTKNRGFYRGEVRGYAAAVTLKNAYFNVDQKGREAIAQGQHHKFAMASIDGDLLRMDMVANLDGVELRFNPKQSHLFVDLNNRAVHHAEEVTIVGHRAYARGKVVYHTALSAPARAGDYPSCAVLDAVAAPTPERQQLVDALQDQALSMPSLGRRVRASV